MLFIWRGKCKKVPKTLKDPYRMHMYFVCIIIKHAYHTYPIQCVLLRYHSSLLCNTPLVVYYLTMPWFLSHICYWIISDLLQCWTNVDLDIFFNNIFHRENSRTFSWPCFTYPEKNATLWSKIIYKIHSWWKSIGQHALLHLPESEGFAAIPFFTVS